MEDEHVHSPPIYGRSVKWRNSEERQLMKWVEYSRWEFSGGGFSKGGVWWVGIFPGGGGEFSKNRFLTSLSFRNELTAASKMSALTLHLWKKSVKWYKRKGKSYFFLAKKVDLWFQVKKIKTLDTRTTSMTLFWCVYC